jgi:hypothetical protein
MVMVGLMGGCQRGGLHTAGGDLLACMSGKEFLPVYNRAKITSFFAKVGNTMEIKMVQCCCEDGTVKFRAVGYNGVQ